MVKDYNPQMHTAEHILNQTMVRMFDKGRSFSSHLEKKKSKCDYHFDKDLTQIEISKIEQRVNEIIKMKLNVTEEVIEFSEAKTKFNLQKLPNNVTEKVRIVKVGDYDACPCIGMHVSNTNEIGKFKIISTSFNRNVLRIRFKLEEHN